MLPMSVLATTSFYKCIVKGVTVYSEKPCAKNAKKLTTEDAYLGDKPIGKEKSAQQQLHNILQNKTSHKSKKSSHKKRTINVIMFLL